MRTLYCTRATEFRTYDSNDFVAFEDESDVLPDSVSCKHCRTEREDRIIGAVCQSIEDTYEVSETFEIRVSEHRIPEYEHYQIIYDEHGNSRAILISDTEPDVAVNCLYYELYTEIIEWIEDNCGSSGWFSLFNHEQNTTSSNS